MKRLAYLVLLMGMVLFVLPVETRASEYLFDVCLTVSSSESTNTFHYLRLGVSSVGGGHYAVNGLITSDPQGLGAAVSGDLEIRSDNSVVASLVYASKNDASMWGRILRLYLGNDGNVYHIIGSTKNFGISGTADFYDRGTVTSLSVPCP